VAGTLVSLVLQLFLAVSVGAQATIIRSFRIGRIFRLVQKAKHLKVIFTTFLITIPSLANVGGLLFLLIYIYSILGVFLFAKVKQQDTLNRHANFSSFWTAFITLIRMSTGENWNDLMVECSKQKGLLFDCMPDPSYEEIQANGGEPNGCGNPTAAMLFFISFMLVVSFIFLNLFIAIILQGFGRTSEEDSSRINEEQIQTFQRLWLEFDPNGTGFIRIPQFDDLLIRLIEKKSNLLRYPDILKDDSQQRQLFMSELELPTYNTFRDFYFWDVLIALSKAVFSLDHEKPKNTK